MKFIFAFTILTASFTKSYSQEFRKLRGSIAFGASDGFIACLEPGYRISDKILAGIRIEGKAFFATKETGSYGINGQYYISNKNFRPFVGLGLSLYHTGIVGDGFYGYSSRNEETVMGFYPRTGFDLGHFSLTIDWNVVANAKATIDPPISQGGSSYTGYINGNYLSVKVGFFIGGGRKKLK